MSLDDPHMFDDRENENPEESCIDCNGTGLYQLRSGNMQTCEVCDGTGLASRKTNWFVATRIAPHRW